MASATSQRTGQGGRDNTTGKETQKQTGTTTSIQDAVETISEQSGGGSTTTSTKDPSTNTQRQTSGPQTQRTREDAAFTLSVRIPLKGGVPSEPIVIT